MGGRKSVGASPNFAARAAFPGLLQCIDEQIHLFDHLGFCCEAATRRKGRKSNDLFHWDYFLQGIAQKCFSFPYVAPLA